MMDHLPLLGSLTGSCSLLGHPTASPGISGDGRLHLSLHPLHQTGWTPGNWGCGWDAPLWKITVVGCVAYTQPVLLKLPVEPSRMNIDLITIWCCGDVRWPQSISCFYKDRRWMWNRFWLCVALSTEMGCCSLFSSKLLSVSLFQNCIRLGQNAQCYRMFVYCYCSDFRA